MLIEPRVLRDSYKVQPIQIAHIGAHDAEEQNDYLSCEWNNTYWFEANPELASKLLTRIDIKPEFVFQGVVSDAEGETVEFYISNNSMSSSVFKMDQHKSIYPNVIYSDVVTLKTITIDSQLKDKLAPDFINLDIQGSELLALKGAARTLESVKWIYTEISFKNLYEGGVRVEDLERFLETQGFKRIALRKNWLEGWGDALYLNTKFLKITKQMKLTEMALRTLWNIRQFIYISKLQLHKLH